MVKSKTNCIWLKNCTSVAYALEKLNTYMALVLTFKYTKHAHQYQIDATDLINS